MTDVPSSYREHCDTIAALERDENDLRRTVEEIKQAGGEAIAVVADISSDVEMRRALESPSPRGRS